MVLMIKWQWSKEVALATGVGATKRTLVGLQMQLLRLGMENLSNVIWEDAHDNEGDESAGRENQRLVLMRR